MQMLESLFAKALKLETTWDITDVPWARGYRTFKNLKTIIYMLTGKLDYTKVGLPT